MLCHRRCVGRVEEDTSHGGLSLADYCDGSARQPPHLRYTAETPITGVIDHDHWSFPLVRKNFWQVFVNKMKILVMQQTKI